MPGSAVRPTISSKNSCLYGAICVFFNVCGFRLFLFRFGAARDRSGRDKDRDRHRDRDDKKDRDRDDKKDKDRYASRHY